MDHVFNIIWAKGVIRKMPDYIVEYLVTEARFLTNSYFSPYDPRRDDVYISKEANQKANNEEFALDDGTDEPNTGGVDAYFKCIVKNQDEIDLDRVPLLQHTTQSSRGHLSSAEGEHPFRRSDTLSRKSVISAIGKRATLKNIQPFLADELREIQAVSLPVEDPNPDETED